MIWICFGEIPSWTCRSGSSARKESSILIRKLLIHKIFTDWLFISYSVVLSPLQQSAEISFPPVGSFIPCNLSSGSSVKFCKIKIFKRFHSEDAAAKEWEEWGRVEVNLVNFLADLYAASTSSTRSMTSAGAVQERTYEVKRYQSSVVPGSNLSAPKVGLLTLRCVASMSEVRPHLNVELTRLDDEIEESSDWVAFDFLDRCFASCSNTVPTQFEEDLERGESSTRRTSHSLIRNCLSSEASQTTRAKTESELLFPRPLADYQNYHGIQNDAFESVDLRGVPSVALTSVLADQRVSRRRSLWYRAAPGLIILLVFVIVGLLILLVYRLSQPFIHEVQLLL